MLEEALLCAIVSRTCEPGKVDEQWDFVQRVGRQLRREKEVEGHFAVGRGGIVGALQKLAAKRGNGRFGCHGHDTQCSEESCRCNGRLFIDCGEKWDYEMGHDVFLRRGDAPPKDAWSYSGYFYPNQGKT